MAKNDYDQYEQDCEKIREENDELLDDFAVWLQEKGRSAATINRHLSNIDLYVITSCSKSRQPRLPTAATRRGCTSPTGSFGRFRRRTGRSGRMPQA